MANCGFPAVHQPRAPSCAGRQGSVLFAKLLSGRGAAACSVRFRHHVRAHKGEPGNEAADALAKAAVKDAMMCGASQDVLDLARRAHE